MNYQFPADILPKHTAILGMTGSGKSTTAGYSHENTKSLANAIGRLKTLGFIEQPAPGMLKATALLFPGAGMP